MLFLVLPDIARDAHTPREQFEQFVVQLVDLRPQFGQAFGRGVGFTDHEVAADVGQSLRRHLLCLVAPCAVGRAVCLDDQSVEPQIHGLLREGGDQLAAPADMARVAEYLQPREAAVQLDGDRPHRVVAVEAFVDRREPAVDDTQAADAGVVDAFHAADPQFEVGTHGVFHQHRDIVPAQRVGDLLHGERVSCRAGPDPDHVDVAF